MVYVRRCAKLCRAKGKRQSEERVGTRACDLKGAWVIGWVGEPVVEEGDGSVDEVAWASRSTLGDFSCETLGMYIGGLVSR